MGGGGEGGGGLGFRVWGLGYWVAGVLGVYWGYIGTLSPKNGESNGTENGK